jgi:alpha-tubulin suppressor-like RCC1 family protein
MKIHTLVLLAALLVPAGPACTTKFHEQDADDAGDMEGDDAVEDDAADHDPDEADDMAAEDPVDEVEDITDMEQEFECTTDGDCDDGLPCTLDLCDMAEHTCSHPPAPVTVLCRPSASACDVREEYCDGENPDCPPDRNSCWSAVSAGQEHTCAVSTDSALYCWGANDDHELGDGTLEDRNTPQRLGEGSVWVDVCAAGVSSCGLTDSGEIWCWGGNYSGQIGDGTTTDRSTPVRVGTDSDWAALGCSLWEHVCAVKSDGRAFCWGDNESGQIGNDDMGNNALTPSQVGNTADWLLLAGGNGFTCGLRTSGSAFCWGDNASGQLGTGGTDGSTIPAAVSLGSVATLGAGSYHACAALTDVGHLYCWGHNGEGQLGNPSVTDQTSTPVLVSDSETWAVVDGGWDHTCAITVAGNLHCWGDNFSGQLGDGTTADRNVPRLIGNGWDSVSAGGDHTCGIKQDSTLYCWGYNHDGQLGNGTNDDSSVGVIVMK